MIISEYIFELLREKGLTQKEFANLTGISQSTISDWKIKKTNPSADKIMRICEILDVKPDSLLSAGQNVGTILDNVVISKDTKEFLLFENYQKLNETDKKRLFLYLISLIEKT